MENCLITTLKGVSENPNLPIYGEIIVNLKRVVDPDDMFSIGASNSTIKYEILGDNDIHFVGTGKILYMDSGIAHIAGGSIGDKYQIRVTSKYDLTQITCSNNGGANYNVTVPAFNPECIKNLTAIK